MIESALLLPQGAIDAIVDHIAAHGARGVETGGFLLTRPGDSLVVAVALTGSSGVTRRRDLFIVSVPVIDRLFTYAEDRDLQVRAHLHSHAREAFLSPTAQALTSSLPGDIIFFKGPTP